MAYSFPLSAASFMDILPIREMSFDIPEAVEVSETGGGELLVADHGARLWQGEVWLGDMTGDEAAEALAMLNVLRRGAGSFMVYDKRRPSPRADMGGVLLNGASPALHSVHANSREIRVTGLPSGYQLLRHDYVAFAYADNPVRFAVHQIAAPAAADGSGLTPFFEVSPNIRAGWAAAAPVQLIKAACKAIVAPGSVQPGRHRATMTVGASFRWRQTLR